MFREKKICDNLSKCNFPPVVVEGSMDRAINDNEMVYVQYCQAGIIKTNFIYCCQVQRGTVPQILSAIQKATETVMDWDHFKKKLVVLGSDGASVMLGKNNGVIALLQEIQPATIAVHCSGHMFELAYKDAIKKAPTVEKVIILLCGLYYMYQTVL